MIFTGVAENLLLHRPSQTSVGAENNNDIFVLSLCWAPQQMWCNQEDCRLLHCCCCEYCCDCFLLLSSGPCALCIRFVPYASDVSARGVNLTVVYLKQHTLHLARALARWKLRFHAQATQQIQKKLTLIGLERPWSHN